jgi:transitional endoplasmic reticulum ATPase
MPMAEKTLAPKKIVHCDVVRTGNKIIVPDSISYNQAIDLIEKQRDYEEQITVVRETFKGYFVLDAAYAFFESLKEVFGIVHQESIRSFFGSRPPEMISVRISADETVKVPWGKIGLRVLDDGFVQTMMDQDSDGFAFEMYAEVKRKFADIMTEVATLTRSRLKESSIYKGKALEVKFIDNREKALEFPEIKFMEINNISEDDIILNDDVAIQIQTNLLAPIKYRELCIKRGVPPKRGILLAGNYGTGKSLTASLVAKVATENGYTFIYVRNPKELFDAYRVMELYSPGVIFCEDIDALLTDERDAIRNRIMNILSGVDTQKSDIITVLTTNHPEKIGPGFLRPGRLDAVIEVTEPDEKSVVRLIQLYGRGLIDSKEDLTEVGKKLAGNIPAVIQEVVEKAKLYQISMSKGDEKMKKIDASALLASANQMTNQIARLNKTKEKGQKLSVTTIGILEKTDGHDGMKKEYKIEPVKDIV